MTEAGEKRPRENEQQQEKKEVEEPQRRNELKKKRTKKRRRQQHHHHQLRQESVSELALREILWRFQWWFRRFESASYKYGRNWIRAFGKKPRRKERRKMTTTRILLARRKRKRAMVKHLPLLHPSSVPCLVEVNSERY